MQCDGAIEELEKDRIPLPHGLIARRVTSVQERSKLHFRLLKMKINEFQHRLNLHVRGEGDYTDNSFVENDNVDNDYPEPAGQHELRREDLEEMLNIRDSD